MIYSPTYINFELIKQEITILNEIVLNPFHSDGFQWPILRAFDNISMNLSICSVRGYRLKFLNFGSIFGFA